MSLSHIDLSYRTPVHETEKNKTAILVEVYGGVGGVPPLNLPLTSCHFSGTV